MNYLQDKFSSYHWLESNVNNYFGIFMVSDVWIFKCSIMRIKAYSSVRYLNYQKGNDWFDIKKCILGSISCSNNFLRHFKYHINYSAEKPNTPQWNNKCHLMFRGCSKHGVCCFRLKMGGFLHLWTRCGRTLLPVYVYLLVGFRIYCKGMLTAMTVKLINIFFFTSYNC